MKKAKVVLLARIEPMLKELFWNKAPAEFELVELGAEASEQEIVDQLRDADFLIPLRVLIPERALREARQLKLIQLFSQGYDRVPIRLTSELGIPVSNAGGGNAIAVAEHTVLLILAVLRRLCPSIAAFQEGKFAIDLDRRLYHQLYEKTVGIVGLGNIGRRVAKHVRAFDAQVIFYEKAEVPQAVVAALQARHVELEELLSQSDVVTLHIPLMESTRGMIGWEQLCLMKPSAILINTSRGQVVDEAALIKALQEHKIAGAGLDVFAQEPPQRDNPLLHMENVVATPHMGGAGWENQLVRTEMVWQNIVRVWHGEQPHNVVTEA